MSSKRNYKVRTAKDYVEAASVSTSIADMCRFFGIVPVGGNYGTVKSGIKKYDIDISHFTGQASRIGEFSLYPISNKSIKDKMIRERGHKCEKCLLSIWLGIKITLELEHIDGNNTNNVDNNLKLLCPNCHSQTPTWRRAKSSLAALLVI